MTSNIAKNILIDLADQWIDCIEIDYEIMNMKSPIEQIFYAHWRSFDVTSRCTPKLVYQFPVGKYFADFYIPILNKIIELDGHEWHEKTPEQAENDRVRERFIQDKGFLVVRFTGREILRSAEQHVYKLYDEAERKINGNV